MIERYRDGIVPAGRPTELNEAISAAILRYRSVMDVQLLHQGIGTAVELASIANGFVETRAPWAQAAP